jgi:two-component system CheB/CheR fusion protein
MVENTETERRARRVPIVGVGASAGGVEALSDLLRHLPADSGLSFVIIQHLAPRRPSLLCPALARSTTMPVVEAASGVRPEANHVYVMPPGVEMAMGDGRLIVEAGQNMPRTHRSIDLFLRSLAEEEQSRAIGVILSGSGSDGTEGLRAIRAAGGIALVEDPASAKFPAMPESAIAAGAADRVLSIEKLAEELVALGRSPYFLSADPPAAGADEPLDQIFDRLRAVSGADFAEYKTTTFRRRLARRMLLRRSGTLSEYLALCTAEPAEVEALARDILIHVTEFFRDPAAFATLQSRVIPAILEKHRDGAPIRVWVPGCSTGEEAYSIAMSLLEGLGDDAERIPVQIFGTDLSAEMIDRARGAIYPESAVQDLPPDYLARYFTRTGAGYRIGKRVRGLCTFATHDLTRDPPFARLDLISCRNVLIYFSQSLQKRVVPMFHHCLHPGGFLMLGKAEAIAGFSELFSSVDKANRIFARVGTSRGPWAGSAGGGRRAEAQAAPLDAAPALAGSGDVRRQADNLVLGRYAPPGALVDEQMDVIHFRGRTSPFLELGPGQPDLNLLRHAHGSLRPALQAAFEEAVRERVSVRREGVPLGGLDGLTRVDIEVIPVAGVPTRERYFLVLFANATAADRPPESRRRPAPALEVERENRRLREEQAASRDFLQSLLDERQRMTSEFTAAGEELVASNEELQSTNEELEAAKEELQSSNEELTTVNDELNLRNQELTLDSVIERAATKNIDLRVDELGRIGPVLGDETRLQQILVNLLSNAVKFTPSGGEVRVELEEADGRARVRVRDTGQGIAPEFLPHVFDRFAQGDTSNTRLHGGLGLGLAIVQDLVRLHGGTVQVTSDGPGRGTLFTVDLPLVG